MIGPSECNLFVFNKMHRARYVGITPKGQAYYYLIATDEYVAVTNGKPGEVIHKVDNYGFPLSCN